MTLHHVTTQRQATAATFIGAVTETSEPHTPPLKLIVGGVKSV